MHIEAKSARKTNFLANILRKNGVRKAEPEKVKLEGITPGAKVDMVARNHRMQVNICDMKVKCASVTYHDAIFFELIHACKAFQMI